MEEVPAPSPATEPAAPSPPPARITHLESPEEARVLGSLMEKEMSTPAYYPMTVNAITAACNQKNNRDPVVEYEESTVTKTLESLRKKMLSSAITGTGYRVQKYKHNAAAVYTLTPSESAIMCMLLLRGPQTPGELRSRSGSLHQFQSLEEVDALLQGLGSRERPLVKRLARGTGQKEARFAHLLLGDPGEGTPAPEPSKAEQLEARISQMETGMESLKQEIDSLKKQFKEFKKQFE